MLLRTHVTITLFFVLLFLPSVSEKALFVVFGLLSTFLPDIDSRFSTIGKRKIARVLQFFTKHRGMIHSFTFLFCLTFIVLLFSTDIALGLFLGYGIHLLCDAFTVQGIRPFYPSKLKATGSLVTGGRVEVMLFVLFLFFDILLLLRLVF